MKQNKHNNYTSKVIHYSVSKAPAYPNAAHRRYRLEKLLDYALTAVTSAGLITALLCLFTFF